MRSLIMRFASRIMPTLLALVFAYLPAIATEIPWASPTYTLVARDMNLRAALDTFAAAEGISIVMSEGVNGTFSGDFKDIKPADFLHRLATVHNLTWYYDGATLYLYGAGEIQTMLIDLKYMKAGEVREMLVELGVEDARFPLKTTSNDELVMVSGPPRYVMLIAEMIAKADKLREQRTFNDVEARIFPLVNTWADDISFRVSSPETTATIKGVARLLDEMMNAGTGQKTHEMVLTNDFNHRGGNISIDGGSVAAQGGAGGAGIGGGFGRLGQAITILDGTIIATGGPLTETLSECHAAYDIGAGECPDPESELDPAGSVIIAGASVHATSGNLFPVASNGTERVYCVIVQVVDPNSRIMFAGLADYNNSYDIYTDGDGKAYIWLPDGTHLFYVGRTAYTVTVEGTSVSEVRKWRTGVIIDGVDAVNCESVGKKWIYNPFLRTLRNRR